MINHDIMRDALCWDEGRTPVLPTFVLRFSSNQRYSVAC